MAKTFSIVTFHFGEPQLLNVWIRKVLFNSDDSLRNIYVIDQNRSNELNFDHIDDRIIIKSFEKDSPQIQEVGHDHAASINKSLERIKFDTSHIVILDSDCFPISKDWLSRLQIENSAVLAADPAKFGLTHPCFMCIPTAEINNLDFSEGLLSLGIDTGRLIGLQMIKTGKRPLILQPEKAFQGKRGDFYLNKHVYHHGSSSFIYSLDNRLRAQRIPEEERFFLKKIMHDEFWLSRAEVLHLTLIRMKFRILSKIRQISGRD